MNGNYIAIILVTLLICSIPASIAFSVRNMANQTINDITGGQQ